MKIRTRLTYQFTIIVALIIIVFSATIYTFYFEYRENEFYTRLKDTAVRSAKLYAKDLKEIDDKLFAIIDKNSLNNLIQENVIIYDDHGKLLYRRDKSLNDSIPRGVLKKIMLNKEIQYREGDKETAGILYVDSYNDKYIVIVSAYDKYGLSKLKYLKEILIIGVFISIGIITIMGLFFSKQALNPIANIVEQAEEITGSNLTQRIHEGKGKDEIAHLAHTFNDMLERIQKAFELQKNFVANSSHELRTPLTAITGQLEVALMNPREPAEYRRVLNSILDDIKNVNRLTNGLLELAQSDMNILKLDMKRIRIDELLWQTRVDLINREPDYKVNIEIMDVQLDDDQKLVVFGNKYLLASAIFNIMENACKFSNNKQVNIVLQSSKNVVNISFTNNGVGISQEDLEKIGQPFYRGANAKGIEGHGIGLSLVYKIIAQHFGQAVINSTLNELTEVNIYLPTFINFLDMMYD